MIQNFPDVTICNVYPFGNIDENWMTWSEFVTLITAKKEQWPYERMKSVVSDLTAYEYNVTFATASGPVAFDATNLMRNVTSHLEDAYSQQLIQSCRLFNKRWLPVAKGNCIHNLRSHMDQLYQKCYTIHVQPNMTEVRALCTLTSH